MMPTITCTGTDPLSSTGGLPDCRYEIGFAGEPSCPCLSLHNLDLPNDCSLTGDYGGTFDGLTIHDVCQRPGYGWNTTAFEPSVTANVGCAAYDHHDYSMPGYDNFHKPNFMGDDEKRSWCYVNASACNLVTLPGPWTQHPKIHQSYATCGNLDGVYSDQVLRNWQGENKTLRVSFPRFGSPGNFYTINKVAAGQSGKAGTNFTGAVVDLFFDHVIIPYNLNVEYVETSEIGIQSSPQSSFTACVHDIARGLTDICIGNFWETADRRQLADFTSPFWIDKFVVIAPRIAKASSGFHQDLLDMIESSFKPFSAYAWLLFLALVVVTGVVTAELEAWTNYSDFPEMGEETQPSAPYNVVRTVGHSVSKYGFGIFTQDFRVEGSKWTSHIVNILMAFTALVIVSSYQAVLVSSLIVPVKLGSFTTMDEAIGLGLRFCGLQAMRTPLTNSYPQLLGETTKGEPLYYSCKNGPDALKQMDAGNCDVAFLSEDEWELMRRGGILVADEFGFGHSKPDPFYETFVPKEGGEAFGDDPSYPTNYVQWHCTDKYAVPTITGIPSLLNAFPCSKGIPRELGMAISWKLREVVAQGKYRTIVEERKNKLMPDANCPAYITIGTAEATNQFSVKEIGGPVFLCAGVAVLILMVHLIRELIRCCCIADWDEYIAQQPKAVSSVDYLFRRSRARSESQAAGRRL